MRPERLPKCAAGVVERSRVLPAGVKLVWLKVRLLDSATEGCTMRPNTIADQLGMAEETVTRYQRFLLRAQLLERHRRADGRAGSTLYATLPDGCRPASRTRQEVERCGAELDVFLRAQAIVAGKGDQLPARADPPDRRIIRPPPDDNPPPAGPADRNMIRSDRAPMGGIKGGLGSSSDKSPLDLEHYPEGKNPRRATRKTRESNDTEAQRIEAAWLERLRGIGT